MFCEKPTCLNLERSFRDLVGDCETRESKRELWIRHDNVRIGLERRDMIDDGV